MGAREQPEGQTAMLARREFLKLAGLVAGAAGVGGCAPRWLVPERMVKMALEGPGLETEVQSICGLCSGDCGVTVRLVDGLPVGIKGNESHPLNRGGLCPVGQGSLDVLYSPDRLRTPLVKSGSGGFEVAEWSVVVERIAARLGELYSGGEGRRIALLVGGSDDLLFELAERVAAHLGSPHAGQLGTASVVAYGLSQGIEEAPAFDLENSDVVFSFGFDLYEDGAAPVRAIAAMVGERSFEGRGEVIYAGTRLSLTASRSGEVVLIRPGTHGALALGVAHVLVSEGKYDRQFVAEHTFGFEDWTDDEGRSRLGFRRLLIERYYPDRVARLCGIDAPTVVRLARRMGSAQKPVAIVGGEAVEASNATWTVLAVQALNALLGSFGRAGGIIQPSPVPMRDLPPSVSPPAPEVDNLFRDASDRSTLAIDPVEALVDRVLAGSQDVDVLVVVGGDPVHDSPAGEQLAEALGRIPMVVALTPFVNETARVADFVLPTHTPLEDWRAVTTPDGVSFSVLGLATPVVEPLYETRGAGDVLLDLGRRALGGDSGGLAWETYSAYLEDRLGGLGLSGEGAIISGSFEERWKHFLEERGWRFHEKIRAEDFWRNLVGHAGWWNPVQFGADWERIFRTSSGRYEFHSLALEEYLRHLGEAGGSAAVDGNDLANGAALLGLVGDSDELCLPHYEPAVEASGEELLMIPFRLPTGRGDLGDTSRMVMEMYGYTVLTGWRTWVEISVDTAHEIGVEDGDLVALETDRAAIESVVRVVPAAAARTIHVPLGLGRQRSIESEEAIGGNPLKLVPLIHDPISGSLATGPCSVHVRLVKRRERGGPAPWQGGHAG